MTNFPTKSDKRCCGEVGKDVMANFARRTILADFKCHALYFHSLTNVQKVFRIITFWKMCCQVKIGDILLNSSKSNFALFKIWVGISLQLLWSPEMKQWYERNIKTLPEAQQTQGIYSCIGSFGQLHVAPLVLVHNLTTLVPNLANM